MEELEPSIPDSEFLERVKKTRRKMDQEEIDALVVFSSYPEREGHLGYLTNYHSAFPPSQYDRTYHGLGYSALVITQSSGPTILPGFLFASGRLVGVDKVMPKSNLPLSIAKTTVNFLKANKHKVVGVVGTDIIPSLFLEEMQNAVKKKVPRAVFRQTDDILLSLRMVKSDSEQRVIERGAKIADIGITAAFEATKQGASESDLAVSAMKACYEEGADYIARTRIYGKSLSSVRWPILTNRKLEQGEITGIDLVGWFNGYGFDVLRRWVVGTASASQKDFLSKAANLTNETIKRLRPKMNGDQVSKLTLEVASEMGIERKNVSPFGHAIGLEIVENPILLPKSNNKLAPGATLCVEPGIDSEEFGSAHFEDEVILSTDGKSRVISNAPKDFS